ncbi:MAG TPA: hypothetical protein VGD79_07220 [Thermoanaerobaculia bacterium]|jgi:hypothetical protein
MTKGLIRSLGDLRRRFLRPIDDLATRSLLLQGRLASFAVRDVAEVASLADVEFRVFSQWGDDGILDWLIERLEIPAQSFIEFGVEDYSEANTRFLLINRNWRGLVIDSSARHIARVAADPLSWRHDLQAKVAFITRDNIDALIREAGFAGEIGLLSIDIDGNDYWIWERIESVSPILCVCEYNAVFGDVAPVSVPYDETFDRTAAHRSNLYFGASIAALQSLASRKGYVCVGTNSSGNNAFFVRRDYASRLDGKVRSHAPWPSRLRESRDASGQLTYASGAKRFDLIADLPVVNVETGQTVALREIPEVYSAAWR